MSKLSWGFSLVGMLSLAIWVVCRQKSVENKWARPDITWDAGPVFNQKYDKIEHLFTFVNSSGRKIEIGNVKQSCGCLSAQLAKKVLNPNDKFELLLTVNVPKIYVKKDVFAELVTDDLDFPSWKFRIKFESVPRISVQPSVSHLTVKNDSEGDRLWFGGEKPVLEVYSQSPVSKESTPKILSTPKNVDVKIGNQKSFEKINESCFKLTYPLEISALKVSVVPGEYSGDLRVESPDGITCTGTLLWSVKGPITFSPSTVHFGVLNPEKTSESKFVFLWPAPQKLVQS